jgi:hypothetical protein
MNQAIIYQVTEILKRIYSDGTKYLFNLSKNGLPDGTVVKPFERNGQ